MSSDDSGRANPTGREVSGSVEFPKASPSNQNVRRFGTHQTLTPILTDASRSSGSLRRTSLDIARGRSVSLGIVGDLSLGTASGSSSPRADALQDQKVLDDVNRALRLKARRDARTISLQQRRPNQDQFRQSPNRVSLVTYGIESAAPGDRPGSDPGTSKQPLTPQPDNVSPSQRTMDLCQAVNVEFLRRYSALYTPLALHAPPLNPLAIIRFKRATDAHQDRQSMFERTSNPTTVRIVKGEWYIDANIVEDYIRHGKKFLPVTHLGSRSSSVRSGSSDSSSRSGAVAFPPSEERPSSQGGGDHATDTSLRIQPTEQVATKRTSRWRSSTPKRSSFLSSSGNSLRNMLLTTRAASPADSGLRSPIELHKNSTEAGSEQLSYDSPSRPRARRDFQSQHSDGETSLRTSLRHRKNRLREAERSLHGSDSLSGDVDKMYTARASQMKQLLHSNLRVQRALRSAASRIEAFRTLSATCAQVLDIKIRDLPPEVLAFLVADPAAPISEVEDFSWREVDERYENSLKQHRAIRRVLESLRKANRRIEPLLPDCTAGSNDVEQLHREGVRQLEVLRERHKSQTTLLRTVEELQQNLVKQYQSAYAETSRDYPELSGINTLAETYNPLRVKLTNLAWAVLGPFLDLFGTYIAAPVVKSYGRQYIWPDVRDFVMLPYFQTDYEGGDPRTFRLSWPKRSMLHWIRVCTLEVLFIAAAKMFWDASVFAFWAGSVGLTFRFGPLSVASQTLFGTLAIVFLQFAGVFAVAAFSIIAALLWWVAWYFTLECERAPRQTAFIWTAFGVFIVATVASLGGTITQTQPLWELRGH